MVLDLGEDVSSIWSSATGVVSAPSRVAVDAHGHVAGYGFAAESLVGDSSGGVVVTSPFEPGPWHHRLVRSYVSWLVRGSGAALCPGAPVFLLPPVPTELDAVRQAVEELGGDTLLFHRPLAAAVALDLPMDEPHCHLMVELTETRVALAVIRAGSVVLERRVPNGDPASITLATRESLTTLDPDDDLEIRARGVHFYGWAAPRLAAEILPAMDLPLAAETGTGGTVLDGARLLAVEALPWVFATDPARNHRSRPLIPRRAF